MARCPTSLPQLKTDIFACYTGLDTDILFNRGIDLPGFASYPLVESERGAALGYSPEDLKRFNIDAIELIASVREENGDLPTVLCGQIGPRGGGRGR